MTEPFTSEQEARIAEIASGQARFSPPADLAEKVVSWWLGQRSPQSPTERSAEGHRPHG